jgi:hypothetical protein
MPPVLPSVLLPLAHWWRSRSPWAVVFYRRGRDAFLGRAEARTELEKLAVEEKRHQLAKQRANDVIDLMLKVERIKDPKLRKKAKIAILAGDQTLLPQDEPTE